MIKVIPIGTIVEVNNKFKGMIISISIRKTTIVYEVQQTTKDNVFCVWVNDWEITSKHKQHSIINQCLNISQE